MGETGRRPDSLTHERKRPCWIVTDVGPELASPLHHPVFGPSYHNQNQCDGHLPQTVVFIQMNEMTLFLQPVILGCSRIACSPPIPMNIMSCQLRFLFTSCVLSFSPFPHLKSSFSSLSLLHIRLPDWSLCFQIILLYTASTHYPSRVS